MLPIVLASVSFALTVCSNTPTVGTVLSLYPAGLNDGIQTWKKTPVAGSPTQFTLSLNGTFCAQVGPANDPSTGSPAVTVQKCGTPAPAEQLFSVYYQALINNNLCIDVTGQNRNDGAPLEMYSCNSGTNQNWAFVEPPAGGAQYTYKILSDLDGKCLTACSTA